MTLLNNVKGVLAELLEGKCLKVSAYCRCSKHGLILVSVLA